MEPLVWPTTPPQEHYEEHHSRHYSEHYPDLLQYLRDLPGPLPLLLTLALLPGVFLELLVGYLTFLPGFSFSDLFVAQCLPMASWKLIIGNKLKPDIQIKSKHQTAKWICRIPEQEQRIREKISWKKITLSFKNNFSGYCINTRRLELIFIYFSCKRQMCLFLDCSAS